MYEYESDEDEYDGGGSRKRKSRKDKGGGGMSNQPKVSSKNKGGKEEMVLMAIEQPFAIPETAKEFASSSAFPHIKVKTNVGKFVFSQELWSCRYVKVQDANEGAVEDNKTNNKKDTPDEDDDILLLMQLQQQEDDTAPTRRSTRERHAPVNYADEVGEYSPAYHLDTPFTNETAVTLPGVEYYLTHTELFQSMTTMPGNNGEGEMNESHTIPTVCRSRLGADSCTVNNRQIYCLRRMVLVRTPMDLFRPTLAVSCHLHHHRHPMVRMAMPLFGRFGSNILYQHCDGYCVVLYGVVILTKLTILSRKEYWKMHHHVHIMAQV